MGIDLLGEMHTLDEGVGCRDELMARRRRQDRAIVANADTNAVVRLRTGKVAIDQTELIHCLWL